MWARDPSAFRDMEENILAWLIIAQWLPGRGRIDLTDNIRKRRILNFGEEIQTLNFYN